MKTTLPPTTVGYRHTLASYRLALAVALAGILGVGQPVPRVAGSELRRTSIVVAVEKARPSVVNIQGEKPAGTDEEHPVKGMGTGVIIDRRGYIVTNYHVVEGVAEINVALHDGESYVAELLSTDAVTDLAVIKIKVPHDLSEITVGTSDDLMTGESVVAVGNAYGYGHTVTRGIISSLHRTVEISDTQSYRDLIQTDASINPGNSGGPLLNVDGEMIGVNVAVRAGAQGIGFAIPVDQAMDVVADLMNSQFTVRAWHGIETLASPASDESRQRVVVRTVEPSSPASSSDLRPGDRITSIGTSNVRRRFDVERAMLDYRAGDVVSIGIQRGDDRRTVSLTLAKVPPLGNDTERAVWDVLGVRLRVVPDDRFKRFRSQYSGGLEVVAVRPDSPASRQHIRRGDVLVGMHVWETTSLENVSYILRRTDVIEHDAVKFYILRGNNTLYGYLPVSANHLR